MEGISGHDLEVIERLSGHRIDGRLKAWLFGFYRFGGELYGYHKRQEECCRKCRKDSKGLCHYCGANVPFCEDPLLFQLALIIHMHDEGRFEVGEDNFESARIEWQRAPGPDLSLPF